MAVYVIANVHVVDHERYEKYKALADRSIKRHGGKYLVRGGSVTVLEGKWSLDRVVVVEFSTLEAAQHWWHSDDYAEAKKLRNAIAYSELLLVEGFAPQS